MERTFFASSCLITNRSRCALISRGRKLKTNSSSCFCGGFSSAPASAVSGWVKVAKETLSPKFDFMNSESLDFNSSGDGKGGFCSMVMSAQAKVGREPTTVPMGVNGQRLNIWPDEATNDLDETMAFAARSRRVLWIDRLRP